MTKTLVFQIDDTIDKEITIMLTFDKPNGAPDVKQVVYRVLNFEGARKTASVRYDFDAFVFSAVDGDGTTDKARVAIARGQKTNLIQGPESHLDVTFMDPTPGSRPNFFQCTNNTDYVQDIAIGFADQPLLIWPKVGRGASVFAAANPILTAYDTADYEEGQLIKREIEHNVLLQQDLAGLPGTQLFIISQDQDGISTIKPADPPSS